MKRSREMLIILLTATITVLVTVFVLMVADNSDSSGFASAIFSLLVLRLGPPLILIAALIYLVLWVVNAVNGLVGVGRRTFRDADQAGHQGTDKIKYGWKQVRDRIRIRFQVKHQEGD